MAKEPLIGDHRDAHVPLDDFRGRKLQTPRFKRELRRENKAKDTTAVGSIADEPPLPGEEKTDLPSAKPRPHFELTAADPENLGLNAIGIR